MNTAKKILITGSNGAIGKAAAKALRAAGHYVIGVDLQPSPAADQSITGSITDAPLLLEASQGVNAIIHLAATVDDADFMTKLLPNNIVGLYNILEAARQNSVPRIALASTLQVINGLKKTPGMIRTIADGASALNHYAATKIYAEQMGLLYHNRYQLEVVCPRIGWLPRNAVDAARMVKHNAQRHYLSHADAGRFFVNFVEAETIDGPTPGYAVVFCVSQSVGAGHLDMEPAKTAIGYTGQDTFPQGLPFEL